MSHAGSDAELEPNYYRYAFSFTLPHQLSASFEGAHGSLRYYIKAVLGRRWMRGISVNTIVDLNQNFQASVSSSSGAVESQLIRREFYG